MTARTSAPISALLCLTLLLPAQAGASLSAQPAGPDPSTMTDQQKLDQAKKLFGEAEDLYNTAHDYTGALAKYEQAYLQYAPNLHVFNFNIGLAAKMAGDCLKAKQAFQRFLDLVADHPKRSEAQEKLLEIERSGCANQQPAPAATTPAPSQAAPVPLDDEEDSPTLSSRRTQREEASEREREHIAATTRGPKGTAGIALITIGSAAIVGGAITFGVLAKSVNDLNALMEPGPTLYPPGDYSNEKVYNKDARVVPALNITSGVLLGAGAVALAAGIALMVLDKKGRKKAKKRQSSGEDAESETDEKPRKRSRDEDDDSPPEEEARRPRVRLVGFGPAILPSGGGAAAALRF